MKIAAIQMVSGTGVQGNLDAARALLAQAAAQGAELAVLPEYFCVMGMKDTDKLKVQEKSGSGLIQDFLSRSARELRLWIVGGTLPTATGDAGRARNSSLAYAPSGVCVARYDKMHLFRFTQGGEDHDETRVLDAGTQPVRFELASRDGHIYTVGLSVCYDLRFPELYRALKADLLLVPSAFTYITGQAHWELLLRARAIENLAYVAAAAQGGLHENGRRTWGHSMVVGPWGEILAEQAEGPGVIMGEVLHARLQEVRQRLPALSHRVL
ncbi:carbon-nitrogen hydrolase family protein [Polaromonas naphthalenivorans]|uniref:Nitrilase/cyanide hydratase and apolipoprotein N-acyltransferase n=1 Tax=Polaromonas naphthalenivorans (strain CJ2) TaxID=365044 RepID=A1VU64_POLNA|nr:carbon-nitrogen hydrolase family protein [Polaromonas naphthalenivorans]ABM39192.1 Nitrilase/cyanide hydratase and apolipoprotein N-acyltransferase [Polaromonas naphthalenivorans CJ2]